MIVVIANMNVAEGKGNDVVEAFRKVLPLIRQDTETVAYTILQAVDNQDNITLFREI